MSVLPFLMFNGTVPTLRNRLMPITGIPKLLPSALGVGYKGVLEISIIQEFDGTFKIYFTGSDGTADDNCMYLATASDLEGTWSVNPVAIIGKGAGGAPAGRQANCSMVVKSNGFYYCYATNGYVNGTVYLYKSSDGITFTDLGQVINYSAVTGGAGCGNTSVYPFKVNGKYEMIVEILDSSSNIWKLHRFNSNSLESGWTFVNSLPYLQPDNAGAYCGAHHFYDNGLWHIFYHYSPVLGQVLPDYLAYSTSVDLVTCVVREAPLFAIEAHPFSPTDQLADPFFIQTADNKCFLFAEYCSNSGLFQSQIWYWKFNGTFADLIKDTY
ncbi:glycoside hydrolase family protein [Mucilaginibacter psychrotolerans]|uniref:Glycosyl hydrolase family 32 N-terminal domain-containing protein n=1 Tax=Mucilaginibacter psychrotolerans TaxID=1524096 RepID=A0A4Y8S2E2_9SPHI|nr:hypothetical protein [Mucilaginibacter psychrotolerans]TFF32166.1 hypothetical protein E2R66_26945 [Mucilaginibacter psychrotolerans]